VHPLNEQWPGFSRTELANLKKCLTRQVEIVVKGQATTITLAPKTSTLEEAPPGQPPREIWITAATPFWLKPVLLQSKLVLSSSDLSRVKVTRRDPSTGKEREWVVDCSKGDSAPAPDFWLRDGDRIEVPEKAHSSGTAPAEEAQAGAPPLGIDPATGVPLRRSSVASSATLPPPPTDKWTEITMTGAPSPRLTGGV